MRAWAAVTTWWGATVTSAVVAVGLLLGATGGELSGALGYLPTALSFGIVGSAVLTGRSGRSVGVLFSATGVLVALLTTMEQLALHGAAAGWPDELISWSAWWAVWPIEVTVGLVIAAILVFPDGRLPAPSWRPVLVAAVVVTAAGAALAALSPVNFDTAAWQALPPLEVLSGGTVSAAFGTYRLATTGLLFLAALSLVHRWRRGDEEVRRQVTWVAAAAVTTVGGVVLALLMGAEPSAATRFLLPCIPLAAGVAILQRRLYDVRETAARALLYGTISGLLVAGCLLVAVTAGRLAGGTLVAVVTSAAVVLGCDTVRRRLQSRLNVLLLGDTDISALAGRIGTAAPGKPEALLSELTAHLAGQLDRSYVGVEYAGAHGQASVASAGRRTGDVERIPLVHAGDRVGTLLLARPAWRWLEVGQRRAVRALLPYVALVVVAARVSADRDAAREQLLSVREEERRRLRRLLHDAAGGLSGVALQLDVAADDVPPERADRLLGLRREVTVVARSLRGLAYEMEPSLADVTLAESLSRMVAALPERPDRPWHVEVRAPDATGPIPAAAAVAAYRVALEAVTNAYRHSGARRCTIELETDRELRLVVSDDGRGLPQPWHPGVGVTGMRERAEELGGSVRLSSPLGGGTVVELRLPVAGEAR